VFSFDEAAGCREGSEFSKINFINKEDEEMGAGGDQMGEGGLTCQGVATTGYVKGTTLHLGEHKSLYYSSVSVGCTCI
jgi:hypothetical protein